MNGEKQKYVGLAAVQDHDADWVALYALREDGALYKIYWDKGPNECCLVRQLPQLIEE